MKKTHLLIASSLVMLVGSCTRATRACFTYAIVHTDSTKGVWFDADCSKKASSFNWSFGDGTPDSLDNETSEMFHTYAASGTYVVTLTVARKDFNGIPVGISRYEYSRAVQIE